MIIRAFRLDQIYYVEFIDDVTPCITDFKIVPLSVVISPIIVFEN